MRALQREMSQNQKLMTAVGRMIEDFHSYWHCIAIRYCPFLERLCP